MSAAKHGPAARAVAATGWPAAHKWLVLRRASQLFFLALFLTGPLAGLWIAKGTLTSSLTLGVLPLTDPYFFVQSLAAGHAVIPTALLGAAIVAVTYALVGGRVYCAWVCPINPITDAGRVVRRRLGLGKGWQPKRSARLWILATTLVAAAAAGAVAWELVNPVSIVHRGIIFGLASAALAALAVFLFDAVVSRDGWCGHLCPMGAFYGLLGARGLVRVKAERRQDCDDCMDCYAVCPEPQVITPALKGAAQGTGPVILARDCTNCGRCIDVCAKDVYRFAWRFDTALDAPPRAALAGGRRDAA